MSGRAIVRFHPEEPGDRVTLHAFWSADNGYETATFQTADEAIDFCRRRWGLDAFVVGGPS